MNLSRRQLLRHSGGLAGALGVLQRLARVLPDAGAPEGPIFVLLDLAGGNDGLNLVVPYRDDHYYRMRPTLAVPRERVLRLDEDFGLNPLLGALQACHAEGELAVVHGVGPAFPSRSHFHAIDIRDTAADGSELVPSGWIGRHCQAHESPLLSPVAVNLHDSTPRVFLAPDGTTRCVTFHDPELFRRLESPGRAGRVTEGLLARWHGDRPAEAAATPVGGELAFLAAQARQALATAQEVGRARQKLVGDYGDAPIGRDFRTLARLIGAGFPTRLWRLVHGSFDTHVDQLADESALYRDLDRALAAFVADMKAQGNWPRLVLMTTSEFGRRLRENGGAGTDHGIASVQWVTGGRVRGGSYGRPPSLAPDDLFEGNPQPTTDHRAPLATVIERHLRLPKRPALDADVPALEFLPPA